MDFRQQDILNLIGKCLSGEADSREIVKLNVWIESSEENCRYFEEIVNIWDAADTSVINKNIDTAKALERITQRVEPLAAKWNLWFYWQRVAAILILPVIVTSLLLNHYYKPVLDEAASNDIIYNEVHAAYGTRSQLILSDSTLVWLNSGSSLKYPVLFKDDNRRVYLSGEAYFEVESEEKRPFVVETKSLQVRATGTKFNVQDYNNSTTSEVMLLSGRLAVQGSAQDDNDSLFAKMSSNQFFSFNRVTRERLVKNEDVSRYIAWKDGKIVFRNDPLEKVTDKLSMMFNVDIVIQGDQLKKQPYHATFQDEPLEEILKLLNWSAPLNFKELKREPLPDGSFPKKKVIIYPVD